MKPIIEWATSRANPSSGSVTYELFVSRDFIKQTLSEPGAFWIVLDYTFELTSIFACECNKKNQLLAGQVVNRFLPVLTYS